MDDVLQWSLEWIAYSLFSKCNVASKFQSTEAVRLLLVLLMDNVLLHGIHIKLQRQHRSVVAEVLNGEFSDFTVSYRGNIEVCSTVLYLRLCGISIHRWKGVSQSYPYRKKRKPWNIFDMISDFKLFWNCGSLLKNYAFDLDHANLSISAARDNIQDDTASSTSNCAVDISWCPSSSMFDQYPCYLR